MHLHLCDFLQVLLSDTERVLSMSEDLSSDAAFPSLSEASQRQPAASTSSSSRDQQQQQQQQHPLKPYWEYLSFLFRRQPEATPDQMLELSYRDYLQVIHFLVCAKVTQCHLHVSCLVCSGIPARKHIRSAKCTQQKSQKDWVGKGLNNNNAYGKYTAASAQVSLLLSTVCGA